MTFKGHDMADIDWGKCMLIFQIFLPTAIANMEPAIARIVDILSQTYTQDINESLVVVSLTVSIASILRAYLSPSQASQIFIILVNSKADLKKGLIFVLCSSTITAGIFLVIGLTPVGYIIQVLFRITNQQLEEVQFGIASLCLLSVILNIGYGIHGLLLKKRHTYFCLLAEVLNFISKIGSAFCLMATPLITKRPILIFVISIYVAAFAYLLLSFIGYKIYLINDLPAESTIKLTYHQMIKVTLPLGLHELIERCETFILSFTVAQLTPSESMRSMALANIQVLHASFYLLRRTLTSIATMVPAYMASGMNSSLHFDYELVICTSMIAFVSFLISISMCWITPITRVIFLYLVHISEENLIAVYYPFKLYTFWPIIQTFALFSFGILLHKKDTKMSIVSSACQVITLGSLPFALDHLGFDILLSSVIALFTAQSFTAGILFSYLYLKYLRKSQSHQKQV
ncbi:unnamed protein product [Owenia fusiformis]|uniref:Uncharacterized protein n=1 Tax=Owenia fusiformis TaxID=6347 RepID=A0A8S4N4N2_OWEFU|nr:unnamed protein product [Owenia fusiformis]